MNIRIDDRLKKEGDSVFESLGLSPSQAIRGLYEFAVSHRNDPSVISSVIGQRDASISKAADIQRKLDACVEGRRIISDFASKMRWSEMPARDSSTFDSTYKDIIDEARHARLAEKGIA